jgi:hypothetical protein
MLRIDIHCLGAMLWSFRSYHILFDLLLSSAWLPGRRGRKNMVWLDLQLHVQSVSITTNLVSSNLSHGEMHSIQLCVIKFVNYFRQVSGFFPSTGKYGRKASRIAIRYGQYGRKVSWIVKWYGNYERKVSWIVNGKYRRKLWNDMENREEK